jgi:acetylornithine deacetylase/succinyl-diaminopimelate desuccinylase-like protein
MLDQVASVLVAVRELAEAGRRPWRDILLAFVADEETGGDYGAKWLVEEHPELFDGIAAAIGEDRPLRIPLGPGRALYPLACAERGAIQLKLTARGEGRHGSRPGADDAVPRLVAALARLGEYEWPLRLIPVVAGQLRATAEALWPGRVGFDPTSEEGIAEVVAALGAAAGPLPYTTRVSYAPTVLKAGYKANVIPATAVAEVDLRFPAGCLDELLETVERLVGPGIEIATTMLGDAVESDADSHWFAALADAVRAADPEAIVVPLCMGGGTDAKAFAALGIQCYGFPPLVPDPAGRTPSGFHAVNEHVPVSGVVGGVSVLRDFLAEV